MPSRIESAFCSRAGRLVATLSEVDLRRTAQDARVLQVVLAIQRFHGQQRMVKVRQRSLMIALRAAQESAIAVKIDSQLVAIVPSLEQRGGYLFQALPTASSDCRWPRM